MQFVCVCIRLETDASALNPSMFTYTILAKQETGEQKNTA